MEIANAAKTMSSSSFEPRGAGGKLKKPSSSSRRPQLTPYARPTQNLAHPRRPWISKLVDPAYRLISGGANFILPYLFSKSEPAAVAPPPANDHDHDETNADVEQNDGDNNDINLTVNRVESELIEVAGTSRVVNESNNIADVAGTSRVVNVSNNVAHVAGTSKVVDKSNNVADVEGRERRKGVDVSDCNEVSKIEQLIKDKQFSRDEINRLLEIIQSRAADTVVVEQEKKNSNVIGRDIGGAVAALEYSGKSSEEKQKGLKGGKWGTLKMQEKKFTSEIVGHVEEPVVTLETTRKLAEEKHENLNRAIWGTPTPVVHSTLHDDVGTSPVEIARAYMENRTLELGFGSKNLISKDNEVASKSLIPSSSPKSSTCWPGAMVPYQHGHMTPRSQRGSFGLHNFPRTPYSRSIYSKSRSKSIQLQGDGERHLSSPSQQSQTHTYGQMNARGNAWDNGRGSVGPIRRVARKGVSETPKESAFFQSSLSSPLAENFSGSEGTFSPVKSNIEKGGTSSSSKFLSMDSKLQSSEKSVPTVPSHSSQMAWKILEHLERNPPTPKDKTHELKLVTSWKKPQSYSAATSITNEHNRMPHLGGLDSLGNLEQVQKKNSVYWSEDRENTAFKFHEKASDEASAAVKNNSASEIKVGFTMSTHSNNVVPPLDFKKSRDSQLINMHKGASNCVPNAAVSELVSLQQKPLSHPSGIKPVLPSISIGKPGQRLAFSSDNSSGFTFPISTPSSVFSEPPTPSVMPSSLATAQQDGHSIPSYSFGIEKPASAIVFSLPSSSSAPVNDDASDLKFNFGSEKSTRLSFESVGKDAICY